MQQAGRRRPAARCPRAGTNQACYASFATGRHNTLLRKGGWTRAGTTGLGTRKQYSASPQPQRGAPQQRAPPATPNHAIKLSRPSATNTVNFYTTSASVRNRHPSSCTRLRTPSWLKNIAFALLALADIANATGKGTCICTNGRFSPRFGRSAFSNQFRRKRNAHANAQARSHCRSKHCTRSFAYVRAICTETLHVTLTALTWRGLHKSPCALHHRVHAMFLHALRLRKHLYMWHLQAHWLTPFIAK